MGRVQPSSASRPVINDAQVSTGRPPEIEEWLNARVFHPLARKISTALINTPVTPNMVSILGVVTMASACACYLLIDWPWGPVLGFGFHLAWHVLDGADGDLARRTGRASPDGEIVDGVCDHLSHVLLYVTFGLILAREHVAGAWWLAAAAGISRGLQSSCYERARRNYRRWVHGVSWIRQELDTGAAAEGFWRRLSRGLAALYLKSSSLVSADDTEIEAEMTRLSAIGGPKAAEAKRIYGERQRPLVKHASALSTNYETLAVFLILLVDKPEMLSLFEAIVLNLVMALLILEQWLAYRKLAPALRKLETD